MLDFTSLPYKLNTEAKLYCVVIRNIDTDEVSFAVGSEVTTDWLKTTLADATEIILHNGIKFDLIALKLFGVLDYEVGYLDREDKLFGKPVKIVDTLVRSRLLNPDRYGGHGLKAWGVALGEHKGDYTDFSHYNEEMLEYCITPDMRLLGEDLRWKPASEFSVGDNVLGFDENIEAGRHGRRYKNANIEIITETDAEVFEVTLESGKVLKVTKEHKFLVSNNSQYAWVETKDLRTKETSPKYYSKLPCLLPVYEQDTSFDAGWMSGMLDGEGCLSNGKQRPHTLSVAQRPTGTLEKLERVFKKFEVNTSKRDVQTSTDCISLRVTGGFSEVYRALCLFRPERLLAKVNFDIFGRLEMRGKSFNDGVVSVKSVGVQKILKIQTSARTFMCEGYPMHNCVQDTKVTSLIYKTLADEYNSYEGWWKAEKLENKLADLAVKRETYGFWFNKELAIQCLEDLTEKMTELENKVNPILPPKPMNKTNLKKFTPPAIQFKKDRSFSANFLKFVEKHNGVLGEDYVEFYGEKFSIPVDRPIKLYETANISDLDHVKMLLISLGWRPTEWKVRDLTKDTKKQSLTYEKRVETLDRWLNQTFDENKYKDLRLEELSLGWDKDALRRKLVSQLSDDKPVRVPTSPCVRVGVEKELCPNLVKLGSKVDFANDFTLYLTYKHRKSSIAGGDLEDVDYEDEYPNTGFLSMYRTVDGRIPTPAIEIGASTNRYRHIGVCNVARASSIYGKEMRSLFGCGEGMYQFGFDFSSLEARIQGHYILPFNGEELAEQLLASKPNDIHTLNANKLGISRDQAKSISYALMYGASYKKLKSMLGLSDTEAKALYDAYWEAVKPLSDLREEVGKVWKRRGSKYVVGIDGRKINTRSQHSLLNALFQSGGVINAKYTTVFLFEWLEDRGYKCDPFVYQDLDCCGMIEYHDECQLAVKPELIELKKFETEEDYKNFLSSWNGKQLGSETTLRSGKICIAMPSVISEAVQYGIDQAEKHTNLKVALGFEYVVANNWYNCH